ncbi:type II toxin-antitoxin system VapC family toxin [Chelativorans sp.]|uniref:type II toxin-antitoxin system VapC family toxin n=1 Tax=Chelativorans sp. TaxID=2203393 RepID=UPI002810C766|nr:type II toxin-antitoxin system VapC family toxin [Chelativorans sp.]
MRGFVVDASVAVKWLVAEPFSEQAATLLKPDLTLIAPELIFAESANALWAMHRRGDLSKADLAEAVDVLKAAPIAVPFTVRQLAASASRLAVELEHPVYDCFYLALAVQEQYPVVTSDRRFHDIVRSHPYLADRMVHVRDVRI